MKIPFLEKLLLTWKFLFFEPGNLELYLNFILFSWYAGHPDSINSDSAYVTHSDGSLSIGLQGFATLYIVQVGTAYMAVGWRDDVKHQKLTIDIASIDLTWLGGALVMADTQGQLYMYRLHPIGEAGTTIFLLDIFIHAQATH